MQYAIAIRTITRWSERKHGGETTERASQHVQYIPTINRAHATDMQEGLQRHSATSYSHEYGNSITEVIYELVYVIRDASGKRMYLDNSEVEHIVLEYTRETNGLPKAAE